MPPPELGWAVNTDHAYPFPIFPKLLIGKRAFAQKPPGNWVIKVLLVRQKDVSTLAVPWEIREGKTDNVLSLY